MSRCSQIQTRLKHNYRRIALIVIIVYASYLRMYGLGVQSFWIDEGFSSYVSKYLALGTWTGSIEYFLHTWSQVLAFKIGGVNQRWARIPSVVASILTMGLMYLIPYKLYKDKRIALLSVFVFGFLTREIAWARQARFYAMLQLLFVGGIALITYRITTKKIKFFNRALILTYIGILFHPFLYTLLAILILAIIYQYGKTWTWKDISFHKNYRTWIILGALILHYVRLRFAGGGLGLPWNDVALSWSRKWNYLKYYNYHLLSQLGIGYIIGVGGMCRFIYKKRYQELLLRAAPFVIMRFFLVGKGYVMSFRYALLMYPLLIRSGVVVAIEFWDKIFKGYLKVTYVIIILLLCAVTARREFMPASHYGLDFTSPQPDFQSAYRSIPDGQKVIAGFPALCDRYYASSGMCYGALKVDELNDGGGELSGLTQERYTHLSYIEETNQLSPDRYYFVIDNLTQKGILAPAIYSYIMENGKMTFTSGSGYDSITVYKVDLP